MKPKYPQFDFRAAHKELIQPLIPTLHADALGIYRELRDAPDLDGLKQVYDLSVPMPERLRARFDALPSDALALASSVIHWAGHWASDGWTLDTGKTDKRGATWKFANLADQVLANRLGIPCRSDYGNGWRFSVHDGVIRVGASSPHFSTWAEYGPATETAYAALRALDPAPPAYVPGDPGRRWEDAATAFLGTFPRYLPGPWAALLSAGKDYLREPGKGTTDCPECGADLAYSKDLAHEGTCSRYPHARTAIEAAEDSIRYRIKQGTTVKDGQRILDGLRLLRESIGKVPGEATHRTAHHCLPGDSI